MAKRDGPAAMLPVGLIAPQFLRQPGEIPRPQPPAVDISIEAENDNDGVTIDREAGYIAIEAEDGSVEIDLNPDLTEARSRPSKFGDNLAEIIDEQELSRIAGDVLRGIQLDDQSRQQWINDRADGMRILGLKLEKPRSGIDTTAAMEGMSNVRHPMLLEALLIFWANASGEFLPSGGPVKIDDKLVSTERSRSLAETLERDLNYYLTTIATEYYPDTSRALLSCGFGGLIAKKVYNCPLRQRPVSESIDPVNLIVSNAATDLRNSGRYTHVITMRPSTLKRMQLAGSYRDVQISAPSGEMLNAVQREVADMQGVQPNVQQTEDREHTIYECYCELNISGFEDKAPDGSKTGLALPYRVVIEKDSQQVLEIRRNWKEEDESKTAKCNFVIFVLIPGFGFYGIGLLNILGNTTNAMTAAWRETLDAGMFANFPGFLYLKSLGGQNTNEFRIPPGGGQGIDDPGGGDIRQAVMPLPYKDVSLAFVQFQDKITEQGRALGGTTQIQVAEGRQDAPVGTTLAMLEQATRVEKATHKELWRSQSQEMQLLKECFRENPGAFLRAMKQRGETDWSEEDFVEALNDCSLVPQADPNTPSHMHRLMKAMGLIQLDKAYPGVMDPTKIVAEAVRILGFGDFDNLRMQNPQQQMPPQMMLEMQKLADKSQDREFKMAFEQLKQAFAVQQANAARAAEQEKAATALSVEASQERQSAVQNSTDLRQSSMDLMREQLSTMADVRTEEIRRDTAEIEGRHAVKVEEHRAHAAKHKGKAE